MYRGWDFYYPSSQTSLSQRLASGRAGPPNSSGSSECTSGKKAARQRGDHSNLSYFLDLVCFYLFQINLKRNYIIFGRSLLSTMTSVMATTRLQLQASISLVRGNFAVIFYKRKSAPRQSPPSGSSTWRRKSDIQHDEGVGGDKYTIYVVPDVLSSLQMQFGLFPKRWML